MDRAKGECWVVSMVWKGIWEEECPGNSVKNLGRRAAKFHRAAARGQKRNYG